MPTFDGGHCFLTVLLPIMTAEVVDDDGQRSSPVHMVRDALAILPTAHQSPVTEALPVISPFTNCLKTHFVRMAVIEDTTYNGRIATNAIVDRSDRTIQKAVDQLSCPYLMLAIDFDAPEGTSAELRVYLGNVWATMREDLDPIFRQCFDYSKKVSDENSFADYIISCQIETTMPFNDYWADSPSLPSISKAMLSFTFLAPAIGVGGALYTVLHSFGLIAGKHWPWLHCGEIIAIIVAAIVAGAYALYRLVMGCGCKPFPMAPGSDLKSILKALYLQRAFIAFAISAQGATAQNLHAAFGAFLAKSQINNLAAPAQSPGTIKP